MKGENDINEKDEILYESYLTATNFNGGKPMKLAPLLNPYKVN